MSDHEQRKLNAWVKANPLASIPLGLVFVLMGVAIFVNEDGSGRYDMDGVWADYVLAPIAVLFGLFGIVAGIVRSGRQG